MEIFCEPFVPPSEVLDLQREKPPPDRTRFGPVLRHTRLSQLSVSDYHRGWQLSRPKMQLSHFRSAGLGPIILSAGPREAPESRSRPPSIS